ncbi:ROK family protein [Virgibacillus dakarensis]|uniref:Transcriptional regulator n=1 Tax=Lentibacillus populi TaxID=1827502 RepID=A0A9W5TVT0_9BACI|nr:MULTISPECIES: ROK family protein [Bacillaceae]MBT2217082.1 ROK family protein [Virgibacillus dakarensis]MTW84678.1 ROK family protein [Virgibacillus dakarensis]GGB36666.1 transcriptional regulator [Lentibacillus populi]
MKRYLAVDIGGTYIKFGIVDEGATILKMDKTKTPETLDGLLDLVVDLYHKNQDVAGVAISCPGAVSDTGIIYGSSALSYLHGPNIKRLIRDRIDLPIFMENDANCAGYAEVWKGKAQGKKDAIVVVIGTGIGGALIKNGLVHKGANLHGGEFGYMVIPTGSGVDYDTWSATGATGALVKNVANLKHMNEKELTGEAVFEMANDGDVDCKQAIDQFHQYLALGIYNLQYIYDPEIILIGGGISARNDLIDHINAKLDDILNRLKASKIKPVIDTCEFGQYANMLGAVYGFINWWNLAGSSASVIK